jgi:hypothetical protein
MEKNFTMCPHCELRGESRNVGPSTRRTPLVTRSDGRTFHLYLEEQHRFSVPEHSIDRSTAALFRYDLDGGKIRGESTLVLIPEDGTGVPPGSDPLEYAADCLASLLAAGRVLMRRYHLDESGELK